MDEDHDFFEMFLDAVKQAEDDDGRMRVLSKNPRFAVDDPAASKPKRNQKER